ncbi:MAG TPA: type VI secretion system contractile sheath large subunit [Gammaproteobacteria bacterium]|nr:type VI secretion system contractile sheath large subunit [Gammaproteobacteria bacterium]
MALGEDNQDKIERLRLVYRSESSGQAADVELPFRILVLGDFTQDARAAFEADNLPVAVRDRELGAAFAKFAPVLQMQVPNRLGHDADSVLEIELRFRSISDFEPDQLIQQVPELRNLLELRRLLWRYREHGADLRQVANDMQRLLGDWAQGAAAGKFWYDALKARVSALGAHNVGQMLAEVDGRLGPQLDAILHHPDFRTLESAWRSLQFLAERMDFSENCMLDVLNIGKRQLLEEFEDVPELVQSRLYQLVYTNEFGQYGGRPYSVMVGNYQFGPTAGDVKLLQNLAGIAAVAHAPFIAGAAPQFFDADDFNGLSRIRDLASLMEQPQFTKWRGLRAGEDARYVALVLPRFLLRRAWGSSGLKATAFDYTETFAADMERCLWGNAAFAFATRLAASFARYRWCLNVSGKEYGRVDGLAVATEEGPGKIPTQVIVDDSLEVDLARFGFITLTVHRGDSEAAFYTATSIQSIPVEAGEGGKSAALFGRKLAAQLPYLLLVSRLAHYLKVMQREHLGAWRNRAEIEKELAQWLQQYVTDMANPAPSVRARRPLRQAKIEVVEVPGKTDWYLVRLNITPHLKYLGSPFSLGLSGKLDKN